MILARELFPIIGGYCELVVKRVPILLRPIGQISERSVAFHIHNTPIKSAFCR